MFSVYGISNVYILQGTASLHFASLWNYENKDMF